MKKKFALLVLILLFATPLCAQNAQLVEVSFGDTSVLPAIESFTCTKARTTKLNTVSGQKGYWVERDYLTQDGKKFHAVWIDGAGPAGWQPRKVSSTQLDGVWGNGSTFKSVKIGNFHADLEYHPQLGLSLAIRLPEAVLTIESENATEIELLSFATLILQSIIK